ncbi:MAG: PaaI family thioesterase [Alphaproteobacteria bacterium]
MTDIPEGFNPSGFKGRYVNDVGPYWVKQTDAGLVVGLRVAETHINYVDIAHGGVLTTLADVALSLQVNRSEDPPIPVSTVSLTTNFLGPAKLGDWLEAHAHIDRMGKKLAYTSGRITSGGKTLMTMTGVFNIMRP